MQQKDKLAYRTIIAGMFALAVAMGIGRFAFTPLLPMMMHDQTIDLNGGSQLATLNYIGYFVGALSCLFIRVNNIRMLRIGLVSTVLLTLGMGLTENTVIWGILRTLSGISSAWTLVYTSGWCVQQLALLDRRRLSGLVFCGPGVGITLTGLSASAMVALNWSAATGWIIFALFAAIFTSYIYKRFTPLPNVSTQVAEKAVPKIDGATYWLALAYGLSGFGYIITATFLPVIARQELPYSIWTDLFWPIFGVGIIIGAITTTRLNTNYDNRVMLGIMYLIQALSIITTLVSPTIAGFVLGSFLLGLPFNAITLFMMHEAHRLWGLHASKLMGFVTAFYGIGQILGPPLANDLVKRFGSFSPSLICAAVALILGMAILLILKKHNQPNTMIHSQ